LRGGALDSPALENLSALPVLSLPVETPEAGSAETIKKIIGFLGEGFTEGVAKKDEGEDKAEGGADWSGVALLGWLDALERERYPLPSKLVRVHPAGDFGYWVAVHAVYDGEVAATLNLSSDRKKKRIDVETENVEKFTLFLNDLLVDLDEPFDIYVNGELSMYKVERERSAEEILGHFRESPPCDPGCIFTAEVKDILVEKKEEEKKDGEDEGDDEKGDGEKEGEKKED